MQIKKAEFIGCFTEERHFPKDRLPEIAFLGRSNVGKSSMINALLNTKNLARTSNTPGKTRGIHFYLINDAFCLVDLPGYGYAKVSKEIKKSWQPMVESYLKERENLIVSTLIIDSRHPPFETDFMMQEWLHFYNLPFIMVLTKIDKAKSSQIKRCENALRTSVNNKGHIIKFSAKTKQGKKLFWQIIDKYLYSIKQVC